MAEYPEAPDWVKDRLRAGLVIPAHPLALTNRRRLDERHQRALTRYYHAAGAGGVAVGVHTTQFEIREPRHGLFEPVLELAVETVEECERVAGRGSGVEAEGGRPRAQGGGSRRGQKTVPALGSGGRLLRPGTGAVRPGAQGAGKVEGQRKVPELGSGGTFLRPGTGAVRGGMVRVAGICGRTGQAVGEAQFARETGYHVGLLSLAALKDAADGALLDHCRAVAEEIPLMGFYLQPAVGGRVLSYRFWRGFVEIPNLVAIKLAPFNRYQTLEVVRAVAEAGLAGKVALYTGNDDAIVSDFLTEYAVRTGAGEVRVRMVGGLLGHWACWTRRAVELLGACRATWGKGKVPSELLTLGAQVTECNAAVFDAAHGFAGCIAGIMEVLRGQGLVRNTLCLNPKERLSPGQRQEIERVRRAYPELTDDEFVRENLENWLRD